MTTNIHLTVGEIGGIQHGEQAHRGGQGYQFTADQGCATDDWVPVANSSAVIGIAVLRSGRLLGIGTDNELWVRDTLNSPWVHVDHEEKVISIAARSDGLILGVGEDLLLYTWELDEFMRIEGSGNITYVAS